MSLDVSIVVVSFNTRDLLRECLRSTFASLALPRAGLGRPLAGEVWVVDNASGDGSAAMVAAEFPAVKLIANETNRGFAAANNQALVRSQGRYVLLLNPDTCVLGNAIGDVIGFMDRYPAAGAAGASLLNGDGSFQHSSFRFPTLVMSFFDFFPVNHRLAHSGLNGRYPRRRYSGGPFAIDHPLGAFLVVRRAAADEVGWLDEDFFIYCEEIDWCLRLKRAGWQIYCVPQAKVVHYGGQSTRQFRGQMLIALHRCRLQLFRKHYHPLYIFAHRQIVRLGMAKEARQAVAAARAGLITAAERDARLATYEAIRRL